MNEERAALYHISSTGVISLASKGVMIRLTDDEVEQLVTNYQGRERYEMAKDLLTAPRILDELP